MISFAILAVLMLVGAVAVVTLRRPVHAALALVGTLLALAVSYLQLQAHFLAAVQVIVYAGAIMVLFLFVIMLLNVQDMEGGTRLPGLRPLAWVAALAGAAAIGVVAFTDPPPLPEAETIAAALGGGDAGRIGDALFGPFLLAFHLVGVLLLTGIVGAVGLVQRQPAAADARVPAGAAGGVPPSETHPGVPGGGPGGRGRGAVGDRDRVPGGGRERPGDRVPVGTAGRRG